MIYKGNNTINALHVGNKLVQQAYLGSKKIYPEEGTMPQQIKDSLVLWYDIRRQGATNESMAQNEVLHDLSGNGHDAKCNNFAWNNTSGIYACVENFDNWRKNTSGYFTTAYSDNKLTVSHITGSESGSTGYGTLIELRSDSGNDNSIRAIGSMVVKIENLPDNVTLEYYYMTNSTTRTKKTLSNGLNLLPASVQTEADTGINFCGFYYTGVEEDVDTAWTIELLYPAAADGTTTPVMISDGVDDYAFADDLPQLTEEGGFTMFLDRDIPMTVTAVGPTAVKGLTRSGSYNNDFCELLYTGNDIYYESFGKYFTTTMTNAGDGVLMMTNEQTKTPMGYTDSYGTDSGTYVADAKPLYLFGYPDSARYSLTVFRSILLFNRVLTDDEQEWVKKNLIAYDSNEEEFYGIEFYTTDPSPNVSRIGNMQYHATLPVQSAMRGCLLADDGAVNKYLDADDWTSETRDGTQGQVMVEVPTHYVKFETDGNRRRVKLSMKRLAGFTEIPKYYVSAYEATVERSTLKLCSVVNSGTNYRGGNNDSTNDGNGASLLGKPASALSRVNFKNYARNRKTEDTQWNIMPYHIYKDLFWLFTVEYATLNSQATFNAEKDSNGFRQGGLGNGVTTLNNNKWSNFNSYHPFINCGHTDSLGNNTGVVEYSMPFEYVAAPTDETGLDTNYVGEYDAERAYEVDEYVSSGGKLYQCIAEAVAGTEITNMEYFTEVSPITVSVPRYRGIENPFGHIWKWVDGINVRISPDVDNDGDGLSKVYVCDDPAKFNDTGYDGYSYIGDEARTQAYVTEIIFGNSGDIMPKTVDGSATTYFCDYHYTTIPTSETLRAVLFGGRSIHGASAGFAYAYSSYAPSYTTAYFGARLCFIPNNV